jgi:hypothetical protein
MRMSKKERDWIRTREKRIVFKRRKPDYSWDIAIIMGPTACVPCY